MLYFRRPDNSTILDWLHQQSNAELSYPEVGATSDLKMPEGYHHIDFQQLLGRGDMVFASAIDALRQWTCFHLPWSRLVFDGKPEVGHHLAITVRIGGIWSTHCCRVIKVDPGVSNPNRWGFTVGTLPRHMVCGEESISVELDESTRDVTYRIRSFSRPNWRIARWWVPLVRHQQKRFCQDSFDSMQRFVMAENRLPAIPVRVP